MCTFSTKGKTISIFPSLEATAPIIYLNTVSGEGQKVFKEAQAVGCPPFTLIAVSGLDWNHDMAPWDSPAAFKKGEPFTSGADDYLRLLVEEIISRAEKELPVPPAWRGIAGYSLAGLFALYASSMAWNCWVLFSGAIRPVRHLPDRCVFAGRVHVRLTMVSWFQGIRPFP